MSEAAWCLCRFPETWDHSSKKVGHLLLLIAFKVSQPNYSLHIFTKECFLKPFFGEDRISMLEAAGWAGCPFLSTSHSHTRMVSSLSPAVLEQRRVHGLPGAVAPLLPCPRLSLCSLVISFFCGWNGQRNQNQCGIFPLLCICCCTSGCLQREV